MPLPFGFVRSAGRPSSRTTARAWAAKASFTSITSRSSTRRFARPSLGLLEKPLGGVGIAVGEHRVAHFVVRVALEGDARRLGVELERRFALAREARIEAKERE